MDTILKLINNLNYTINYELTTDFLLASPLDLDLEPSTFIHVIND